MSHADLIPEGLIRRVAAQLGPLGVDVRLHAANVQEMVERQPGLVENPAGLFVTWCQREADAHQARTAAATRDRERYAELQVGIFAWVASGGVGPRLLARVLEQASREGYPALNRRTIEKLRALGAHWPAGSCELGDEAPSRTAARDVGGALPQGTRPGRSCARAESEAR